MHTPGPWTVYPAIPRAARHSGIDAGQQVIVFSAADDTEYCGVRGANAVEAEANARLIAAGPDLLAALRELVERHDAGAQPFVRQWDAARSAIAKATEAA